MVQREARVALEAHRDQLIAAMYANSNFSGEEGGEARADAIRSLEKHFARAITSLYYPKAFKQDEIDWNNPFWSAAKRSQERLKKFMEGMQGVSPKETVEQAAGMSKEQVEARTSGRQAIDQI